MEMAINLLEECGRKGESKYAPYIASLPNPEELVLPPVAVGSHVKECHIRRSCGARQDVARKNT